MKRFVGYIADKIVRSIPSKKKVSPTIKSVKPTKDIAGSEKRVKGAEYSKRIDPHASFFYLYLFCFLIYLLRQF